MSDTLINSAETTETLLNALADQLAAQGEHYTLAVVGGSALLALRFISRATRDVDVLAIVNGRTLESAQPLPATLLNAARVVARDFGLAEDWLNAGPASLLAFGLPEGFYERAERRAYGSALQILFASRVDQIHLKLYATVDQGPGKHLDDLQALRPTEQELVDAARWSRTHDSSEGYRDVLSRVLVYFGVHRGHLGP